MRLGIIAGGGDLPGRLLTACERKGIRPFVIGFEGHTDPATVDGREHIWIRLGASGQAIGALKSHGIRDIVLIGSVRRPSVSEILPDLKTIGLVAKIGFKAFGDNDLLASIRRVLEGEGFNIRGVHEFADDLLAKEGVLGKYKPKDDDWVDIERGREVLRALGLLDVGQSVIAQERMILGVEAAEGTDELIRRCAPLKRKGRGGVLVKLSKPQQDTDLDLPTIGPRTAELAAECGLAGIAIEAGRSLILDPERVAEIADKHRMFVVGLDFKEA